MYSYIEFAIMDQIILSYAKIYLRAIQQSIRKEMNNVFTPTKLKPTYYNEAFVNLCYNQIHVLSQIYGYARKIIQLFYNETDRKEIINETKAELQTTLKMMDERKNPYYKMLSSLFSKYSNLGA